jgi:penicillin-binding protein 1A
MTEASPPPSEPGENKFIKINRFLIRQLPQAWWMRALLGLAGLAAMAVLAATLVALVLTPTLPDLDELADPRLKVPMRVFTADGELIAEFGEEKRIPVRIDEVPDLLVKAILAAEDHTFFYHHGVDYLGFVRAAWHNLRAGAHSQGASTITMQVARNFLLSPEKTYTRKLKEILLSFKIERELSKKEILELYINKIFLGHRAYGFAAAAQIYYGKNLKDLTLAEMAMLAGLPKAPSRDNPLTNPENATERRNYVLRHMRLLGYISEAQHQEAIAAPQTASRHAFRFAADAPHIAEMVRLYMIERYAEKTYAGGFNVYTTIRLKHQRAANRALRHGLAEYDRRHGWRGASGHIAVRGEGDRARLDDALKDHREVGGLVPAIVIKVLEKSIQAYTQDGAVVEVPWPGLAWARRYVDENSIGGTPARAGDVVRVGHIVHLERLDPPLVPDPKKPDEKIEWQLGQIPDVGGAIVVLDPNDGAILALSGGFDFYHSSFNRAVQAGRQPGSSFKPFIYSAAIDKGFTPATTVSGAPIVEYDASIEAEWRPEDYNKKFVGPTRLRKALALSLNLVSIRLLRAITPTYAVEYLERFGFDRERNRLPRNLTLVLGTASVSPLEMARAYAVFANGGHRVEPYFILRVEDGNGKVLEEANPARVCPNCPPPKPATTADAGDKDKDREKKTPTAAPSVLSPETSFIMTTMLREVIRSGTGYAATEQLKRRDLAGKTGTTNDYRDAWFAGYTQDMVVVSWIGFDQNTPLGRAETGGRAALPIWIEYMRQSLDGVKEKPLPVPAGIVRRWVNAETGEPAKEGEEGAIEEFFLKDAPPGPLSAPANPGEGPRPPTTAAPAPAAPTENIRQQLF